MDSMEENSASGVGISGWLRNRLNVESDIDMIAASPPDHDSQFPAEFTTRHRLLYNNKPASDRGQRPLSSLLIDSLEDSGTTTESSTDNTPFVTPQGSPMIPRRLGGLCDVSSQPPHPYRPKKWLLKSILSQVNPQEAILGSQDNTSGESDPESPSGDLRSMGIARRCKITSFDLNAISPQSF